MQTGTMDNHFCIRHINVNAHAAETGNGGQTVFPHQKTGDMGIAFGKRTEHHRTVGNRFISRYLDGTPQGGGGG